jgi:hypothetical protein
MTRKDFLVKLTKIVEESQGGFGDKHDEEAEYILSELEKQGLIKPKYEPYPGSEHQVVFNGWEPESEG